MGEDIDRFLSARPAPDQGAGLQGSFHAIKIAGWKGAERARNRTLPGIFRVRHAANGAVGKPWIHPRL